MTTTELNKGVLLIAEPSIICDASFNRSVVLLAEFNKNGAVGFIINKPLPYTIQDFLPNIDCIFPVYNGGPVAQDSLYFIHQVPELIPDSLEISQGIYWGGNFNIVVELLKTKKIDESKIRFFLGYSGWEKQQLEEELKRTSWIVIKNTYKNEVIGITNPDFWKEKMIEFGGNYILWSNAPEDPSYN